MLPMLLAVTSFLLVPQLPLAPAVPSVRAGVTAVRCMAERPESLAVQVGRIDGGGLGIEIDPDNRVATSSNPALKVGDIIVAVDGVDLDGRHVTEVLQYQPEYTFGVKRQEGSGGFEDVILALCKEHASRRDAGSFDGEPMDEDLALKLEQVASQLEATADAIPTPLAPALLGFWELAAAEERVHTMGLTGYGELDFCSLAAHFQCFQPAEKPPTMQTVEVIANSQHGAHMLATLKGDYALESDAEDGTLLSEEYDRAEYGGERMNTVRVQESSRCSYVSDRVRLQRPEGGGVRVYLRKKPDEAMGKIRKLLESAPRGGRHPTEGSDVEPRWAAAERERMALADRERMAEGNRRGAGGPQVDYGGGGRA